MGFKFFDLKSILCYFFDTSFESEKDKYRKETFFASAENCSFSILIDDFVVNIRD